MYHQRRDAIPQDNLLIELIPNEKKEEFNMLFNDQRFIKAKTYQEQVVICCKILREENELRIPYELIGVLLGKSGSTIHSYYKKSKNVTLPPGRPPILTKDALDFVKDIIMTKFIDKKPVTYDFLIDEIQKQFFIDIKSDTLRHICRTMPEVKNVTGIPMEKSRVEAKESEIENYYTELDAMLDDVPGAFIFNIDEAGCSEWCDASEMKVLVPSSYEGNTIKIPVDRNSKRSTLVACISGDGKAMKPLILLSRKTLDDDIRLCGYSDEDALFAHQKNAFMTTRLFDFWADQIFFPTLVEKRKKFSYCGPAILLLDGLGAHYSADFIEECNLNNVYVLYFVPHTSDQCQPLDLLTFSLLKKYFNRSTFKKLQSSQSNQIVKMLGAWYQSTAPHLIQTAFTCMGLSAYFKDSTIYWKVSMTNATRIRNLKDYNDNLLVEPNKKNKIYQ